MGTVLDLRGEEIIVEICRREGMWHCVRGQKDNQVLMEPKLP
jgi:hypothetical protein